MTIQENLNKIIAYRTYETKWSRNLAIYSILFDLITHMEAVWENKSTQTNDLPNFFFFFGFYRFLFWFMTI